VAVDVEEPSAARDIRGCAIDQMRIPDLCMHRCGGTQISTTNDRQRWWKRLSRAKKNNCVTPAIFRERTLS